jgi:hypothetical protein
MKNDEILFIIDLSIHKKAEEKKVTLFDSSLDLSQNEFF